MKEASTCSASARSIGRPSADSSAHSSSAVDSERAVGSAIGRPGSAASAASCNPASVRASSAQRASRSARSAHPPLTHSGRRCPSGATGSSSSPSSGPDISNRSSGPPAGSVWVSRPRTRAQAQPGSARQPPNSSRCAAAISQHVARRTPPATRCAAVWPDQTAHLGRNASSACPTSAARAVAARAVPVATGQARSPVATPRPRPGETTSPTRSPRAAPASRNDVTRSTDIPCHGPRGRDGRRAWPGAGTTLRSAKISSAVRSASDRVQAARGQRRDRYRDRLGGRFESFSARFRNAIGPGRRFRRVKRHETRPYAGPS